MIKKCIELRRLFKGLNGTGKLRNFSKHKRGEFFYLDFISEKFSCFNERVSFADVELEH